MDGTCSTNGEDEKFTENLVKIPEGKGLFERPRHKWEVDIEMHLKEVVCGVVN
jgi:hypothetical protein